MNDTPHEGIVVPLVTGYDPAGDEAPAVLDPKGWECNHRRIRLDATSHRVFCSRCDKEVDPWEWINWIAREWAQQMTRKRAADKRTNDAEQATADLERRERNAKARVRKWEDRVAEHGLHALVGLDFHTAVEQMAEAMYDGRRSDRERTHGGRYASRLWSELTEPERQEHRAVVRLGLARFYEMVESESAVVGG